MIANKKLFGLLTGLTMVFMGLLTVGVPRASADTIFSIDNPNSALSGFTGPYATVTVHLVDSTHATITFDSLINGGFIYLMGDGGTADANVNGTYTLGAVTETNSISGFTPTFVGNAPGQVDGMGIFNLSLDNFDGFTDSATHISFSITDTSGTWLTSDNVLVANGNGFTVGIHAFACAEPGCSTSTGAAATGFAANGQGGTSTFESPIPEPSSFLLLGSGLLGLAGFVRRRFRKE